MTFAEELQIAGWLLTVVGQIQVALKQRQGFITWIAANAVLIACSLVGLWWSIGMYATNVAVCAWSFARWSVDAAGPRRLFAKRTARWRASPWN